MTRRFREREGPFGGRYWEDEEGKKIHEREGPFGGQYTEDDEGRKVEERTGPFGGRYAEDGEGGRSQEAAGPGGSTFVDGEGKRTRHVTGAFGERQVVTDSDTPILPERPARPARFSLPRSAPSSSSSDDAFSGIAFLLGALVVLVLVLLFIFIGLPILAGVWLAKFTNRRWVEPVAERHRWRWAILPAAFAAGALPTNELVAAGYGALQCREPQSVSCASYRRNPTPTVLGLHRWLVQRDGPIAQPEPPAPFQPPIQREFQPQVPPPTQGETLGWLTARDPAARINLRQQPGASGASLGYGLVGDQVTITGTATGNDGQVWSFVRFPNGRAEGWIRSDFIATSPQAAPQPSPPAAAAAARPLEQAEAIGLIERWLASKGRVFAPPYDVDAMEGLVGEGPLRYDITKPNGSIDWLRANSSQYSYQRNRISGITALNLGAPPPSITVTIDEQSTLQGPKGSRSTSSNNQYLYTFGWQDGRWQILDARQL
ncbi:IMS domain-containing protein [Synechococcus sp. CCAP 1479/9]|uniref:IMS domain-containing protein n=1 Tax=Synechococcus sp. CCAP 1479/9 TaxID=1221593 RepID=UPI001C2207FC|nr:IMS domain-containing protein [Synechococcus sp. CCAP 1479/9]